MKKLSEKGRRILRKMYVGLGAVAASLLFPGCNWEPSAAYGMPPDGPPYYEENLLFRGRVKSKKTGEPISGISIWIKDITSYSARLTDSDGSFYFWIRKQDNYTVVFTDVDGENGGLFKQHTINLTLEECEALTESPLLIELEEAGEELDEEADDSDAE